jgi:hypothetical protein
MNIFLHPNKKLYFTVANILTFITLPFFVLALEKTKTIKGEIDLIHFDIEKKPIELKGEWEFYWKNDTVKNYWDIEKPWNTHRINGKEVGSFGYATFVLKIKNIPNKNIDILVKNLLSACRVFINDSLVVEIGKFGKSKDEYRPRWEDRIITVPSSLKDITLVVQIANFHHRKGGFEKPFIIGNKEHIYAIKNKSLIVNSLIMSSFLFSGLFFLTIYLFRKKDLSILYFSVFCLISSPRSFFSGEYIVTSILPNIKWNLVVNIEYFTLIVPVIFILLFISEKFKKYSLKKVIRLLILFIVIEVIVLFFTPASIFTWLVIPHEIITIISIVVISVITTKALIYRENGAVFAFIAIVCLIASAVLTIVDYVGIANSSLVLHFLFQISFILMMSLILGSNFSSQFSRVEYLQKITEHQKNQLEEKNHEILDSITYAKRIQNAILPPPRIVEEYLQQSFILYNPKDIVAGDFYWMEQKDGNVLFAAADCTGHGVPGAMVSVICVNGLNRSVREHGLTAPGKILDKTREIVVQEFEKSDEEVKDGMDISLAALAHKAESENGERRALLQWSGANNPLWIIANENRTALSGFKNLTGLGGRALFETKPNKQPIGKVDNPQPFTTYTIELQQGDTIYLFTDGYQDQFGGEKGKKFKASQLKELLLSIQDKTMDEQKEFLDQAFEKWRGNLEQVDDVCIIGVRV